MDTVDGSGSGGDFIQENRAELRFDCADRRPASVTSWSSYSTGTGAETGCGRDGPRPQGHVHQYLGCTRCTFARLTNLRRMQIAVLRLAGVQVIHIVEGILAFAAGFPSCRQGKLHPDNQSGRSSSPPCLGHSCREPSNYAFQSAGHSRLSRETSADLQDGGTAHQSPDAHRQRQTNDRHGDERDITQRAGLSNSHRLGHVACELRPGVD